MNDRRMDDFLDRLRRGNGDSAAAAAEIERLLEALKKIVDTFESKLEDADAAQIMGETAREALTAAKGSSQ